MAHIDRFKAEKITDIKDEAQFIEVLRFLSTSSDNFIIKNGYIYINSKDEREGYVLWFVRIDVIQEIYEIYKRCLITDEPAENYYVLDNCGHALAGLNYLMLGGSFKLIAVSDILYEDKNLLFPASTHRAVTYTNDTYYNVPTMYDNIDEFFGPAKSIDNCYKFKKHNCYKFSADGSYIMYNGIFINYIADPYDSNLSFPCNETKDLINVVTGQRTQTWPLEKKSEGLDAYNFIKENTGMVTEIQESCMLVLYYDKKWDIYHYRSSFDLPLEFKIVKMTKSGKTTKATAADADADLY